MARRSRIREGAYTLFFMLAVTVGFIAATSATYLLTRDRIETNDRLFVRRAVMRAAGLDVPDDPTEATALFDARVRTNGSGDSTWYEVDAGSSDSVVVMQEGAGLWGTIRAAVGLDRSLDGTMTGIAFTRQNETPGLGARIEEKWFTSQFAGKRGPFTMRPEGEPTKQNEFDAITGATVTSTAVRDIVNTAIDRAPDIVNDGNGE